MMINHSFQTYGQVGARQLRHRNVTLKVEFFPGGKQLWVALLKVCLLVIPIVFAAHLLLGSAAANAEQQTQQFLMEKQQLEQEKMVLLTQRAQLLSPARFEKIASTGMALHFPGKGQVIHL